MWAVELRREESRRRLEDLVGPAQLPVLLLEPADLGVVLGRDTRPLTRIHVRLVHPLTDRLHPEAQLASHPLHRPVTLPGLLPDLAHQPDRLLLLGFAVTAARRG